MILHKAHLHLLKPRFLNSRFFVSPFTLAQKTANLAQVRNFAIFLIGTAHARTFHIFPSIESAYNCVCVCVCVCVCACACVCVCVCARVLTQMSSFSNFDIIVLDWGAYKMSSCVCVCVCVCVSNTSVIAYWVKYNSPRLGPVPAVACVSNIYVLV